MRKKRRERVSAFRGCEDTRIDFVAGRGRPYLVAIRDGSLLFVVFVVFVVFVPVPDILWRFVAFRDRERVAAERGRPYLGWDSWRFTDLMNRSGGVFGVLWLGRREERGNRVGVGQWKSRGWGLTKKLGHKRKWVIVS
ncbi:hypothetical protein BVRB_6g147150 [Beta vulgaris subsp. vulgaris]|nr:hypothetical protein BVRB_6g147150 [Beta vulgaris subsp. vulgaris]